MNTLSAELGAHVATTEPHQRAIECGSSINPTAMRCASAVRRSAELSAKGIVRTQGMR